MYDLQKCSLILWIVLFLLWCSLKILIFMKFSLSVFSFVACVVHIIFEKALPSPRSQRFTRILYPMSFLVLAITFQCLICFELNFGYGEEGSNCTVKIAVKRPRPLDYFPL